MAASARPLRIGAMIGAGVLALCGCSASPPASEESPSPTPTPTPEVTTEIVLTRDGPPLDGTGSHLPISVALAAPEGDFRSLSLDFACTGGGEYLLELGNEASPGRTTRRGICEGTATFLFSFYPASDDRLGLIIGDGTAWNAAPQYSTAAFTPDPAIKADCEAFGPVYSAIFNADAGFSDYADIDEAEWNERVDAASDDLEALAAASESPLAESFAELVPVLRSPDRIAGDLLRSPDPLNRRISDVCAANETLPTIEAEYGG
ncbi:MAG: hypothetical protein WAK00_01665 [Microbacterium sp.]|uniref:hypothetical protein n=1 Tax=Microbacterium sp. TaxID=51671 RepID=UPI003BB15BFB